MITNYMLLTQQGGILKPFAIILGYILEGVFWVLDKIGIPNTGLAIIIFTVVIYLLMIPLTYKQQKFSKLNNKMNPELMAIRKKYEGKNDQDSMMRMNAETQAVYQKYGVNPSGSCLQLLIQMPILFALYRVIYSIPAYVGRVKEAFFPLVDNLVNTTGSAEFIRGFKSANFFNKQFSNKLFNALSTDDGVKYTQDTFIDVLNRASTSEWASISEKFPALAGDVNNTTVQLNHFNKFLGLNIANSPQYTIQHADGNVYLIVIAILIPVLACLTQWINTKLMPQAPTQDANGQENAMMSSLKTMNTIMPIMSAVFCFTLPVGMGLYWVIGAVIRSVIQIVLNKRIDRIDIDQMVKDNLEKLNEKRAKQGLPPQQIQSNATLSTRNIGAKEELSNDQKLKKQAERAASVKDSTDYYNNSNISKPGSLASKANMVKLFNEKNNKKES